MIWRARFRKHECICPTVYHAKYQPTSTKLNQKTAKSEGKDQVRVGNHIILLHINSGQHVDSENDNNNRIISVMRKPKEDNQDEKALPKQKLDKKD